MQNEPNFKNAQINVTIALTKDYMKNDAFAPPKNEPNQTQFKVNFAKLLLLLTGYLADDFSCSRPGVEIDQDNLLPGSQC